MKLDIFKQKAFYIAFAVTLVCSLGGRFLSGLPVLKVIGAMVIALLLGMILQVIPGMREKNIAGIGFISNKFLRLGIILLGFKLNLSDLVKAGPKSIGLAIFVVAFTIVLTYLLAKAFKAHDELALLTASGCGICGAAAVMGITPQVKAKADDSVIAVAIVAILGTIFTVITTLLQPIAGLSEVQYGVWCGASLHEIAHVVAAAGAATTPTNLAALDAALIMKLSRVLLLAPAAIIIGIYFTRKHADKMPKTGEKAKLPIPWFMLGFLATSAIGTLLSANVPAATITPILKNLEALAFIILGMAMSALGLSVNFKVLISHGHKVLKAAVIASVALYVVTWAAAKLFF